MTSARGTQKRFSELVHQVAVVERRRPLKALAHALGMKYATLYARVSGRVAFSTEEANCLVRELADARLASCLLQGTPFIAVGRPNAHGAANGGLLKASVASVRESAEALAEIEGWLETGAIDQRLLDHVKEQVEKAEAAIAALREEVAAQHLHVGDAPDATPPHAAGAGTASRIS